MVLIRPKREARRDAVVPRFRKNVRPKENHAECRWVYTEAQIEPISSEALHHETSCKRIKSEQTCELSHHMT